MPNVARTERRGIHAAEVRERHLPRGIIIRIDGNDDRLQCASLATVHYSNHAGRRRRMAHPGTLVRHEWRSTENAVTHIDAKRRLDAYEIGRDPAHEFRRGGDLEVAFRSSGERNIESFGGAMHGQGVRSSAALWDQARPVVRGDRLAGESSGQVGPNC